MVNPLQVYKILDNIFPFSTQEEWDNSGLLVNSGAETAKILICLDVTKEAVNKAVETGAKLILSHHPVIFGGLKTIDSDDIVYNLIKNDISVISAHTNFDKYRQGTCYAIAHKLGLNVIYDENIEIGISATCKKTTCKNLALKSKDIFGNASFTLPDKEIENVFICAGSGGGMTKEILYTKADCFITGESKYHDMLDLSALGVAVIEVGHDASEKISLETLEKILKENLKDIKTEIFIADNLQHHI